MAGSRRDVDLVIRARDQAAKVVDAITDAIIGFVDSTKKMEGQADKTDSVLGRLASAAVSLDKAFKAAGADQLTKQLQQAEGASQRLEKAVASTAAEGARLAGELDKAKVATQQLREQSQQAANAVSREADALKAARASHSQYEQTLNSTQQAYDKAARAEARLTDQIAKQNERVTAAQERFERLGNQIQKTAEPTATLQARLESAFNSLNKAQGRLSSLNQELQNTRTTMASTSAATDALKTDIEGAAASVAKAETALAGAKNEQKQFAAASKAAAQNMKGLEQAAEANADALARQEDELKRSAQSMSQLSERVGAAEAEMDKLAASARGPLLQAFGQQRKAVDGINQVWREQEAVLAALAQEIGRVGVPTREMVEAQRIAAETARAAKEEYQQQAAVLQGMRAALREGVSDVGQLAQKQREFAQAVNAGTAGLNQVRAQAQQSAAAQAQVAAGADRAARAAREFNHALDEQARAADKAARANGGLANIFRSVYGESRKAMSITQRLRGEVLALITTYAGLYGVINTLGDVVKAYQMMEAAQSRLNVVTGGNADAQARELDFIRRTANRLGIEMGTLADQYSQFAVATRATQFEGQATRDIFLSVAEAARVQKLSLEDTEGVFKALTQIIGKGKVQAEELRGQLGDRLPGAVQIMARALNVSTAELDKMMEQGKLTADALIPFARQLKAEFGGGLTQALNSSTALMGQLGNVTQQTMLVFANNGFMKAFEELLRSIIDTMKSADFQQFVMNLSQGFAVLVDVIRVAVENWRLLVTAATAFATIALIPVVVGTANALRTFVVAQQAARAATVATTAAMGTQAAATGLAAASMGRLATAARFLMSGTGIGLIITAVAAGLALWGTNASAATDALTEHQRQVDIVRSAYELAGGEVDKWKGKIEDLTVTQAKATLVPLVQAQERALTELQNKLKVGLNNGPGNMAFSRLLIGPVRDSFEALEKLTDQFSRGEIEASKFRDEVDALAQAQPHEIFQKQALAVLEAADEYIKLTKSVKDQEAVIEVLSDTASEATAETLNLATATEKAAAAMDDANTATMTWEEGLAGIKEMIPELAKEMDALKERAELMDLVNAMGLPETAAGIQEVLGLISQANLAIEDKLNGDAYSAVQGAGSVVEKSAALLRQFEGFIATPKWDVNAYRVGFGSDTITLSDGTIKKVTQGMAVSVADAQRDLTRRIGEFQGRIVSQIGIDRWASFTDQQQAALTSIAYNYGSLPERIVGAVKAGSTESIVTAIKGLAGDNDGINRDRRNTEAAIFGGRGVDVEEEAQKQIEAAQALREEEEKRVENAREYHNQLAANLEQQQFELDIAKQGIIQRETEKALREAELAAKAAGTELTKAEIEAIKQKTAAQYADQAQQEAEAVVKERIAAAESLVNDLLTQRNELEAQLAMYQEDGNEAAVLETQAQIDTLNGKLREAIDNAIAMWQAVGGTQADAAIARLRTASMEAGRLGSQAKNVNSEWQSVAQTFSGGLTNAFKSFAQAVANGENAFAAARDAFLQFASDFLIKIGEMIIQKAIFNAIGGNSGGPSGGFGGIFGWLFGAGHTGGKVGSKRIGGGNQSRRVNPAVFANADIFHEGGLPGLRQGEVAAILEEGEEVLSKDNPRNILNGGAGARPGGPDTGQPLSVKIVNTFDAEEVVSEGLNSAVGEQTLLNVVQKKRNEIRDLLQ